MYAEEDLLPLSALSHLVFCKRRTALIFIEGQWSENLATMEGTLLHKRADEPGRESRKDLRIARGLRLRSVSLGLSGIADVVDFYRAGEQDASGPEFHAHHWTPFPVEYKRGKRRDEKSYSVQLCAQAMCLEEMLGVPVPSGAVYYGKSARRLAVEFTESLRAETVTTSLRLHELIDNQITPPAVFANKCHSCSLFPLCLPEAMGKRKSASAYLTRILSTVPKGGGQ